MPQHRLWHLLEELHSHDFVDLTHSFRPGIPHAYDFPDEMRTTLFHFEEGVGTRGSGFMAHQYCLVGQWGTHADPPIHFVRGGRYLDDIPVTEMILPMVVFDIGSKAALDPDYELTIQDINEWESLHGQVPTHSFAALRSGWSRRWPDSKQMQNADEDGVFHFPGWNASAIEFLCENRDITACGHETTDTDRGLSVSRDEYPAERSILTRNKFQIELLANLEKVPPSGAIAVVTFPKPYRGSGFPARVFAILP